MASMTYAFRRMQTDVDFYSVHRGPLSLHCWSRVRRFVHDSTSGNQIDIDLYFDVWILERKKSLSAGTQNL